MSHLNEKIRCAAVELPEYVDQMVDYAIERSPDAIVVCDRNARPIGRVFAQITEERQDFEAPIYFKRVSKHIGDRAMQLLALHTKDVAEVLRAAPESPRVMVLDDYVSSSASTANLFRRAMRSHEGLDDLAIDWVTLCGRGTARNIRPLTGPSVAVPWRDLPHVIGVDYDGIELVEISSPESGEFNGLLDGATYKYLESNKT